MLMARQIPDLLIDGPKRASRTIVLAHGAGAGMDTPFMNFLAEGLAETGLRVVRFEFPYMAKARKSGKTGGVLARGCSAISRSTTYSSPDNSFPSMKAAFDRV